MTFVASGYSSVVLTVQSEEAVCQLPEKSCKAVAAHMCTAGWASAWFALLAVVLILVMNTKLIYIARHTARGGAVHRLNPTIFWFGAKGPW